MHTGRKHSKKVIILYCHPTNITYFASDDFMEEEPDEKELDINCL